MFFYLRWFIKKRTTFTGLDDRRVELEMLKNDIDRITDRDAQLVEDRINRLKTLLSDVDKRIAAHERELENLSLLEINRQSGFNRNETLYTSLGKGIRAALTQNQEAEVSPPVPEIRTQDHGAPPPLDENNSSSAQKEDDKPVSKMQIRSSIDNLAQEGLSSEEIASRLNISAAEVNLAMNLRSQGSARSRDSERRKN